MPSVKISLFDDDDPKQWKAFEDAMARAFLRAVRIASKEHTVSGYTPPAPEVMKTDPIPPRQPTEFGVLQRGGNAGHQDDEDEPSRPGKRRRHWGDACQQVFSLPDGYISIEDARIKIGGNETVATNLIRDWVFGGVVEGVIWCTSKTPPTWGLPGHLMINESQLAERIKERMNGSGRHAHSDEDHEMSTGMTTGIPATSH